MRSGTCGQVIVPHAAVPYQRGVTWNSARLVHVFHNVVATKSTNEESYLLGCVQVLIDDDELNPAICRTSLFCPVRFNRFFFAKTDRIQS